LGERAWVLSGSSSLDQGLAGSGGGCRSSWVRSTNCTERFFSCFWRRYSAQSASPAFWPGCLTTGAISKRTGMGREVLCRLGGRAAASGWLGHGQRWTRRITHDTRQPEGVVILTLSLSGAQCQGALQWLQQSCQPVGLLSPCPLSSETEEGFRVGTWYLGWHSFLAYPRLPSETPGGVLDLARTWCAEIWLRRSWGWARSVSRGFESLNRRIFCVPSWL
jgi:hypothetical protein